MRFLILRILTHSELGMFHEYRRQKKERSKQRAVNFDWDVVDRVFPAAKDSDLVHMDLRYETDHGIAVARQWLKRQEKNWRLEGNCPKDGCYHFVEPGCLFAMEVDSGRTPACGSWAVFPKGHAVTKAILADGESSKLARSAMIALHDREGERTWRVLGDARPGLFTPNYSETIMKTLNKRVGSTGVELPPDPSRLVQILASVGHTLPSAVADLVDNSISANATKIDITFGRPDAGRGRWLTIADNGDGMSRVDLEEAMRIGSGSEYREMSLGKYGYGLKGASWSQTKVFTVVSKCPSKPACHLTWDAGDMAGWIAKANPLEVWEQRATAIKTKGTTVLWKDMRPPQSMPTMRGLDAYSAEVMMLERHLALVFHRFLEGHAAGRPPVKILINGNLVQANNPVGHPLVSSYDQKTIRLPNDDAYGKVQVQAYLLPSEEEVTKFHKAQGAEEVNRALDLIGLYGKRNETQGLFIYRHDRLIKWGGWHQMWETNDEKTKLARVVVNFGKDLDEALKINISKQIVHLPQQLQTEIKKIADVARRDSQKKYRKDRKDSPPLPPMRPWPIPPVGGGPGLGQRPAGAPRLPTPQFPTGKPAGSPDHLPRIAVKAVKTDKFVWKVIKEGIIGEVTMQVSGLNPDLSALVAQIGHDPRAIAHLATFLSRLDEIEAQKLLMAEKGA